MLQPFDCGIIWFVKVAYFHPSCSINHEDSEEHVESFSKKEDHVDVGEARIPIWAFLNSAKMLQITKTRLCTLILS